MTRRTTTLSPKARRPFPLGRRALLPAAAGLALALGAAASGTQANPPASAAERAFLELREGYFVGTLGLNPVTASYLGADGYRPGLAGVNARLRDYRPAALEREVAYYKGVQSRLGAMDPAALSPTSRVDREVVRAQIAFVLRQIEQLRTHEKALETYVIEPVNGVNYQLQQMTDPGGGLLGSEAEWAAVAARVEAVPAYLDTARVNLLAGKARGNIPDRRMVALDGVAGGQAAIEFLNGDLLKMAKGYLGSRPFAAASLTRLTGAGARAAAAYRSLIAFLGRTYDAKETVDRYAIGAQEYGWRVRNNFRVQRSVQQLHDYGRAQVALYGGQMLEAAERLAGELKLDLPFGTPEEKRASTLRVLAEVAKDAPASDEQLYQWYRELGAQAVAYGRARRLFDIPTDYRLEVVETPPVLQSSIVAAYNPAPPFAKSGVGQFYVTPTGNDRAQLAASNRGIMADTAVHEGFPGHDWAYKYQTKNAARISDIRWITPGAVQDTSSMWEDSMAAEGWAHYAEALMAEPAPGRPYGFYTPKTYLGFLQEAQWRAVRVVVDTGLHSGSMSFDGAVDYFTTHYALQPGACARAQTDSAARGACDLARREIYRYSKWPTQAITYNLGKQAILELREAYKAKQGASYSERAFHEAFLAQGTIPPGYFAGELLGN